jgi:hypothetical protein
MSLGKYPAEGQHIGVPVVVGGAGLKTGSLEHFSE